MTFPSPSDFFWAIKLPPGQEWIDQVIRAAIESYRDKATRIAVSQFGDDALVAEMMEAALERTVNHLKEQSAVEAEDAGRQLSRFYILEVRRRRYANRKLVYLGSASDIVSAPIEDPGAPIEAVLDLDAILRDTPPELRFALLLRHGSHARWDEVAKEMDTSADSIRMRCMRELKRIRERLRINEHAQ
jgi:DNA-directed RNA polymerase specialized sigma24 family protein